MSLPFSMQSVCHSFPSEDQVLAIAFVVVPGTVMK